MKQILLISVILFSTYTFSQLSNGRLVHYKLDGDGIDQEINSLNGTLMGPVSCPDRYGTSNTALTFDGSDDYVSLPFSNILKPQFPISIAFWAKIDQPGNGVFFFSDYKDYMYYGFWVGVLSNNIVHINFGSGTTGGSGSRKSKESTTLFTIGEWQHIYCVIRSENDMDIYIDCKNAGGTYSGGGGSSIVYSTDGSPHLFNSVPLNGTPASYLKGQMDDLMIWNRELTVNEISSFCQTASIKTDNIISEDLKVFPNPVKEILLIDGYNNYEYNLIDLFGKSVQNGRIIDGQIDLKELSNGQYVVKITTDSKISTIKIIKE